MQFRNNIVNTFSFILAKDYVVFRKIIEIYVRWVSIHELIHLKQLQYGGLTECLREFEKEKPVEKITYEQEAIERSNYLISQEDDLSKMLIKYFWKSNLTDKDKHYISEEVNKFVEE